MDILIKPPIYRFVPNLAFFRKSKEFCVHCSWKSDHELGTGGSWKNSSLGFLVGSRAVDPSRHPVRGRDGCYSRRHGEPWVSVGAAVFSDVTCPPPPELDFP